jgi:Sulfotransferase family
MSPSAEQELLFIIGSGRCGSTMMQEVLARHPEAGFISNLDANILAFNMKGRWNNFIYRHTPRAFTQRDHRFLRFVPLRMRFGPSEAYRMLNRRVSLLISETKKDLTEEDVTPWLEARFRRFFEERMEVQKKPLFLCKFAGWPRARFIHEIFPEARFLHVVRDGRAVADSLVRRPWWRGYQGPEAWQFGLLSEAYEKEWEASGRSFVVLAGIQWLILMDAFEQAREALPEEAWMQVRYEDFVIDPRGHMEDILRFAGVEWTEGFEKGFSKYAFMPERRAAYLENLTAEQVGALEAVLGGHLERLGYEIS